MNLNYIFLKKKERDNLLICIDIYVIMSNICNFFFNYNIYYLDNGLVYFFFYLN